MKILKRVLMLSSLLGLLSGLVQAQEVTEEELNMVSRKCETLLIGWNERVTSEKLADNVLKFALTEQKGWDTGAKPSLFRAKSIRIDNYGDLIADGDPESRDKELTILEKQVLGVSAKGTFRLGDMKFTLEKKLRETLTLNSFAGRKHIGAVDLDMSAANFAYEDRMVEEIARFHRSNSKAEDDSLEKSWLRIMEPHLRLAVVQPVDEKFSVAFSFHLVTDTLSTKCDLPESAEFMVCRQPIDIMLVQECRAQMARGVKKLSMVTASSRQPKELCGVVIGRIARPGMVHTGLEKLTPKKTRKAQ